MLIPVGVEYTARRYPVVTFSLMGINIAIYLLSLYFFFNYIDGDMEQREWFVIHWGLIPSENVWWTYFTSMFVHGGFFHLLGNMIFLFLFGSCVEDIIGRWQFAIFYIVSGLIAAGTYALVVGFNSEIPMVGASGAISGCIGGFVLVLAKTKINFRYFIWFFFRIFNGEFSLPAWLVISFWFLRDLFSAVITAQVFPHSGGVAFAAHVGGTIAGAALIGSWKLLPPSWKFALEDDVETLQLVPVQSNSRQEVPSIYLYFNGAQHGPFTSSQISQMIALGGVGTDTAFWQEGMTEWQNIADFSAM